MKGNWIHRHTHIYTHTHTHTYTHIESLSPSHACSRSLSLSHTHTHTNTYTYIESLSPSHTNTHTFSFSMLHQSRIQRHRIGKSGPKPITHRHRWLSLSPVSIHQSPASIVYDQRVFRRREGGGRRAGGGWRRERERERFSCEIGCVFWQFIRPSRVRKRKADAESILKRTNLPQNPRIPPHP